MKVAKNISDLIGSTPLMELSNFEKEYNLKAKIFAKLEYFNPAGSIKDRVALSMIKQAETDGIINQNSTIIEPTSGNTGIGLAAIASSKGFKAIFTMPETMSVERRKLLQAYGAKIVLTEGKKGMKGAIEKAVELSEQIPDSFIPSQFTNLNNPKAHYLTTGPEIWNDTDGKIDILVAGVGTGGTITGIGEFLKSKNPNIKIVAVEPFDSPVLSKGTPGSHKIQGIGAGFVPETLNTKIYDEIITVKNEDAFKTGRFLAQKEGLLVGISSGASVYAASILAKNKENENKIIVSILPDGGERYLSTEMFNFSS